MLALPVTVLSAALLSASVLAPAVSPPAVSARAVPPPAVSAGAVPPPVVPADTGPSAARAWTPPLRGSLVVLRPFDPPAHPWSPGHRGVDLAARPGAVVLAAGAGVITFAATLVGRGVVVVSHPDGLRTTYEPVEATVSTGEQVGAGEPIGILAGGQVHCGQAPTCLHWGLRRGREYLDPWLLLDPGRVVLLPLSEG